MIPITTTTITTKHLMIIIMTIKTTVIRAFVLVYVMTVACTSSTFTTVDQIDYTVAAGIHRHGYSSLVPLAIL